MPRASCITIPGSLPRAVKSSGDRDFSLSHRVVEVSSTAGGNMTFEFIVQIRKDVFLILALKIHLRFIAGKSMNLNHMLYHYGLSNPGGIITLSHFDVKVSCSL